MAGLRAFLWSLGSLEAPPSDLAAKPVVVKEGRAEEARLRPGAAFLCCSSSPEEPPPEADQREMLMGQTQEEAEERLRLRMQASPHREAKVLSVCSIILVPGFVFLLPLWSYLLNDVIFASSVFGVAGLCDTIANQTFNGQELVQCAAATGASYAELVKEHGLQHRWEDGELFGCSCEQGWLGDWLCPVNGVTQFSISYFISTPPGTGAMAAVMFWPITAQWLFGQGSITMWQQCVTVTEFEVGNAGALLAAQESRPLLGRPNLVSPQSTGYRIAFYSAFVFQFCFGLFLIGTLCVAADFHLVVVGLFIVAQIVHMWAIAFVSYVNAGMATSQSRIIITMSLIAIPILVIGLAIPESVGGNLFLYAFWFAECVGITLGFLIAPVLTLMT